MQSCLVYAIHGFLGNSKDWATIKDALPSVEFIAENLFSKEQPLDQYLGRAKSLSSFSGKKIFLGYSLGGRLGLQLLKENPGSFDHYIFLSTNPGLLATNTDERKARIDNDQKWSNKIKAENWDELLLEWNSQAVFQGSNQEPRRELDQYDLQKLKVGILKWSLGEQDDFSDIIQLHNRRITWVVGDIDRKYREIAEKMKNNKILLNYQMVSSGHRIWLDNPSAVVEIVKNFLTHIS